MPMRPYSVLFPPGTPVETRRTGITATAHQLAPILLSMLKTRQNHDEPKAFAFTPPGKAAASNISSDRLCAGQPKPLSFFNSKPSHTGQARFKLGLIDSACNEARDWNGIYE
jgi:hypothetical protein